MLDLNEAPCAGTGSLPLIKKMHGEAMSSCEIRSAFFVATNIRIEPKQLPMPSASFESHMCEGRNP